MDGETAARDADHTQAAREASLAVPVIGLSLGGCGALTLEAVIRGLPGVTQAYVNPATETAYVRYDHERLTATGIIDAIRRTGYATGAPGRARW